MTQAPRVHATARRSTRINARLAGGAVTLGLYVVTLLVLWNAPTDLGLWLTAALVIAFGVWSLWLLLAKGKTLGYLLVGLVAVDPATGRPAGGRLFVRSLLQGLVSGVSLGIAEPIVSFVSFDGRTTWFDRTAGVVVVSASTVTTRSATTSTPAQGRVAGRRVATRRPAAGVTPVSRGDDIGLSDPTALGDLPIQQAAPGWKPVSSSHAPIQNIPTVSSHAPEPPAASPSRAATPTGGSKPSGSVQVPADDAVITGVPWGSGSSASSMNAAVSPPRQETRMTSMRGVAPVGHERHATPAHDAVDAAADHTVVDAGLLESVARTPIIRLDDGQLRPIQSALVLGRDPVPPADHPEAVPMPLADPTMKVSKTHALVVAESGRALVTDLASTNGVRVARGEDAPQRLTPWEPYALQSGERVFVGGRSFEVDL